MSVAPSPGPSLDAPAAFEEPTSLDDHPGLQRPHIRFFPVQLHPITDEDAPVMGWGAGPAHRAHLRAIGRSHRKHRSQPARRWRANWDAIAVCESSGRWHYNGTSGFDGGLQFLPSTWTSMMRASGYRFGSYAYQATRVQQIMAAEYLIGPMGANPWRQ